jgi:hypothetical protein
MCLIFVGRAKCGSLSRSRLLAEKAPSLVFCQRKGLHVQKLSTGEPVRDAAVALPSTFILGEFSEIDLTCNRVVQKRFRKQHLAV